MKMILSLVSDEDEIPNPLSITKFSYNKYKYGIFMQNIFYYKFNVQNETEAAGNMWPGSRICLKKKFKRIFLV